MARPREFDPEEALDKAMHQFWAKGYHDTSIRDLVSRTGVNYYGLYGEFENKRGLFLAALDLYRDTVTASVVAEIKADGPARRSLRRAFDRLMELTRTGDGDVGCMMCNAAVEVAPYDPAVAAKVRDHLTILNNAFTARIVEGQKSDELAPDGNADSLGEFLAATAYSAGLLRRAGQDDALVRRHIETALSVVG